MPKGAEFLIETRQPYLTSAERREVLRTTAIESGNALTDDVEGWGRLNLYAAADGYGAFDSDVTVTMDASAGGFSARDIWRNDISGSGTLIKEGTGELDLTGRGILFQGGIRLNDGVLVAASAHALGNGGVMVNGGSLIDSARSEALTVEGDYTQSSGGSLELDLGHEAEGPGSGAMIVRGEPQSRRPATHRFLRVRAARCVDSSDPVHRRTNRLVCECSHFRARWWYLLIEL